MLNTSRRYYKKPYTDSDILSVICTATAAVTFSGATLNVFSPQFTCLKAQWL